MSDAPARIPQDASADRDSMEKARGLANTIVLKSLASRAKANPSTDLSRFLRQQADSYPRLCNDLAQRASRRGSASSCSETSSQVRDEESLSAPGPSQFHLDGDINILYPLVDRVVSLASGWENHENPAPGHFDKTLSAGIKLPSTRPSAIDRRSGACITPSSCRSIRPKS
ncbi:hypothetical protein ACRE_087480 [Hapsidospora chrysogenum ATCC 11550]|uniref:Uncharacterized protein n=1 Tax=Hapsidospora chrysogenum (strain ATCC 11550 / CBS 779.69 / DSM 880 / IAM 14645 / JCM 23072 / IMI 49137) TaxID=857340 RepID=A0A086STY3_HAPC1|nr:hypothetical protein ACRE_087480 [Hapsidospora chrysogenum ATCC 11550]